ncbi:MAG: protein-glutamine gamma-glutamyltransferase [Sporolactobacillus sp.]|jgi:protein-glutamine gamma-glutamyltransferase|nr:protein-glutamine gamma-glutamyltransferase [Sporolactobacillus sp.]
MIIVSGQPPAAGTQELLAGAGRHAPAIYQAMNASHELFAYPSRRELLFEISLRSATVDAARALNESGAAFATFYYSACNETYWSLTDDGGFELRPGQAPAEAIRNIFTDGEAYAFECATAMMIVFYKALVETISSERFNAVFKHLYLWDWQNHPFFPLRNAYRVERGIPGDVRYFKNPAVNPQTPQWQGENAVDLSDGLFYGHGVGIRTADEIIAELNRYRRIGGTVSAFLMNHATRPDYLFLAGLAEGTRTEHIRIIAGTSFYTF